MAAQLIGLSYSPYTERARWALDYKKCPYQYKEYLVLLSDPILRVRTRQFLTSPTVPVLLDGSSRLLDSFDIAKYADQYGTSSPLFPKEHLDKIKGYNAKSEKALDAGRALITSRMSSCKVALRENLPSFVPEALRNILTPLAAFGLNSIRREFQLRNEDLEAHTQVLREILLNLRTALGDEEYILDAFSYADIVMAATLHFVVPVDNRFIRLGDATRACWTDEKLKAEFGDLLAWRDALYQKHRPLQTSNQRPTQGAVAQS